jgi:hypothetical protein
VEGREGRAEIEAAAVGVPVLCCPFVLMLVAFHRS